MSVSLHHNDTTVMTQLLSAYIPMDRRQAWAQGSDLPLNAEGTALFADISGFTNLSETLVMELGARRGAENLTFHLNSVYDKLIGSLYRYSGSVIGFSGDAITCWFDQDAGHRAVACALAMQEAITSYPDIVTPSGRRFSLAMKASLASGRVIRFVVGSQEHRLFDVLAGNTLDHLAMADHLAERGDVLISHQTYEALTQNAIVSEWRDYEDSQQRFAVVSGLREPTAPRPWPAIPPDNLFAGRTKPWIPFAVYKLLASGQEQFLAELRPATALFLRFLGIDYEHDPKAHEKLNTFITAIEKIIDQYAGSLLQVSIGEKGSYLYAAFGAPVAHEDDTHRAVFAALQLRAQCQQYEFITTSQIGISWGRIYSGSYGSTLRRTYGVIGDVVNLAARLMQKAGSHQILVSDEVYNITKDAFQWEAQPPMYVKGKRDPVNTYQLTGKVEGATTHLIAPRYSLKMVGRRAEMSLALQKLDDALQSKGQIVGVVGEAGMGKSRLATEIIEAAQAQGFSIYAGECQSYGKDTGYLVWQTIWRGIFDLPSAGTPAEQIERLRSRLEAINPEYIERMPLLSSCVNLTIPDSELTRSFDAKLRKTSLESLLADCLKYYAQQSPIVLVLDDCQWLDMLSRDLIEVIGRALANLQIMMLLVYRPLDPLKEAGIPAANLTHFCEIELHDFSQDEAEELITLKLAQLFDDTATPPRELITQISARAAGNPFYIEEILNYLRDRGLTPDDESTLQILDLPTSLQSLILSRIDQLSESEKITLKVASVIGRLFEAATVWGVYPEGGTWDQLRQDLQTLDELALTPLEEPEPELKYIFRHILTQEVAYDSLLYSTRAALHEQIGHFIEQTYPDDLDQYVNLLAFHYEQSQNEGKKCEYLLKAGRVAQATYANEAAVEYYEKVIPLLDLHAQLPVLRDLGKVYELVGNWDQAKANYEKALLQSIDLGVMQEKAWSEHAIGELFRKRGWYQEATAWLESARATFEKQNDRSGVGAVLHTLGSVAAQQGKHEEALTLYNASVVIREEIGEEQQLSSLHSNMGIVYRYLGDYAKAKAHYEISLGIARMLNIRQSIAITLNNIGLLAFHQGRLEEARPLLEEAVAIQRSIGNRFYEGNALNNLGNIERASGDYARAARLYNESLSIFSELEDLWALAYLFEDVGTLAAKQGDGARAICLVGAASALRDKIGSPLEPKAKEKLLNDISAAYGDLTLERQTAIEAVGRELSLHDAIAYAMKEINLEMVMS